MAGVNDRLCASAASMTTSTCMLVRPVWMMLACASTSSPALIGAVKCTLPT